MKSSLRAILFDFDGVLADSEPLHLAMFQKVLEEEGIPLSRGVYYQNYLGLDDRGVFQAVYRDNQLALDEAKELDLVRRKNRLILEETKKGSLLMPGAEDFVRLAARDHFLAIVSGALRSEIQAILNAVGLLETFQVIVGAEDVSRGKPAPEGFLSAVRLLNRDFVPAAEILLPAECLVIEDSPWGLDAGKAAGMKCVGLLTSYSNDKLGQADLIAQDLKSLSLKTVERLF